ncbi:pirin family protein [Thalassomonas viridans]|uniref:Pirin family protein n=2 Tax=Thalassomonas viridans TaxID=137584 RepID=A0AAF0CCY4_9GAMM|nr:pirin family protein [Thalassomonas viridans]
MTDFANIQINEQTSQEKQTKELITATAGMRASDGDGVRLTRIIGTPQLRMIDPFLMLDCFESDDPDDYIGGFPTHPHRGFETVTYLLDGRMRHKDSKGNEGVIEPGGVQWMTAGKGILHSEMPEQENGLLKGFQLWVNLPASDKMTEPGYQEFAPDKVAVENRQDGTEVRVIAGTTDLGTRGPVINHYTSSTYMDVGLPGGVVFNQQLPDGHNAFIYVVEGELTVGEQAQKIAPRTLGILGEGAQVRITAQSPSSRFLLVAGKPLNEPVVQSGPFVMNTREEINQAFDDFRRGLF